jgi:hypothetical protein
MEKEWLLLLEKLKQFTGKEANMDAILFLIGIQELGQGFKNFSKEEKQDLMHIGTCKILSYSGYYELEGTDQEGWPHWKSVKKLPAISLKEQEDLLKMHVLEYFEKEGLF